MRKFIKLIMASSSLMLLSGCSSLKGKMTETIQKSIIDGSEIKENEDYRKYQYYESNELLTGDGIPVDVLSGINNINVEPAKPTGSVHVSFARNPYISVFYTSEKNSDSLLDANCYLNPGDTIYCKKPQAATENSNSYYFQEFRIYTYDTNGNRSKNFEVSTAEDGVVYTIPNDFLKEGISIIPVGRFEDRVISLHDYYIDTQGKIKNFRENGLLTTKSSWVMSRRSTLRMKQK